MDESPVVYEHQFFAGGTFELVVIKTFHAAFADGVRDIIEEFVAVIRLARIAGTDVADQMGGKRTVGIMPRRFHRDFHSLHDRREFGDFRQFRRVQVLEYRNGEPGVIVHVMADVHHGYFTAASEAV